MKTDELFIAYIREFNELIERIEQDMLEYEKSGDSGLVHSIFRSMHTIKGSSMMMGYKNIGKLAHALENELGVFRSENSVPPESFVSILLRTVDLMKSLSENPESDYENDIADCLNIIQNYKNSYSPDPEQPESGHIYSNYIKIAEEKRKYLILVRLDLLKQYFLSLEEMFSVFEKHSGQILLKRADHENISELNENVSAVFPYMMLFLSESDFPAELEEDFRIEETVLLYSPPSEAKELPQTAENKTSQKSSQPHYLKVSSDIINELINLTGEVIINRNQLLQTLHLEENSDQGIRMARINYITTQLYNRLMETRLRKLDALYPKIQRVVRDTAVSLRKEVDFYFHGGDAEIDGVIIEEISESLLHILRNAVDHGIENSEERIRNGKNPKGQISLQASSSGGNISIVIQDDGKGLNYQKIKETALEKKLLNSEKAARISPSELAEFIFFPGFSTRDTVSEVSGRGVGMDVVMTNLKKAGGKIQITSDAGKGTVITLNLPQSLSVTPAFIILISGKRYAIQQKNILEVGRYETGRITEVSGRRIYRLRDMMIPLISLGELLYPDEKTSEPEEIAVLQNDKKLFAVAFDRMLSIEEIVLKPLPVQIKTVSLFSNSTISGDGKAILILDTEGIFKYSGIQDEFFRTADSAKSFRQAENYLVFDSCSHRFITPMNRLEHVKYLKAHEIEEVFGRKTVRYEDSLISVFSIMELIGMKDSRELNGFYCLIYRNEGTLSGIIAEDIADIVCDIEFFSAPGAESRFILSHSVIENRLSLLLDIDEVLRQCANFSSLSKEAV